MLEIQLFGGLSVEGPLRRTARQRRPLTLLAVLALGGERGTSRERLAALLWPESDPVRARKSVSQALHSLRVDSGIEDLFLGTTFVALNPARAQADVWEFGEALAKAHFQRAVERYAGPILDGFELPPGDELERFIDEERRRYAERFRIAVERLARSAADRGDTEQALRWSRLRASSDPLSSRAALALMDALVKVGDRGGALQHAAEYERTVRKELGAAPDPMVVAMAKRLRDATSPKHSPVVSARAEGPPPSLPAVATPPDVSSLSPPATVDTTRRTMSYTKMLLGAGILLVLLIGGIQASKRLGSRREARTQATLAVLPFAVRGDPSVEYLSEGMVDLISTSLDGAGELRSVDPRALLRATDVGSLRTISVQEASRICRQFGASVFVLGDVTGAGDRLRISAALYEVGRPDPVANAAVEGSSRELFQLVDRLASELLASRFRAPGDRLARSAALTTLSLVALKSYLRGEQELRGGRYTAALTLMQRATSADSTFALAHYRASVAAEWAGRDDVALAAAEAALRHSENLSEHDRMLVTALVTWRRGEIEDAEHRYRDIVADHPDDTEAWFQLGEVLFHGNPARGRSATEARAPYERVLALDPTDDETLMHLARIAWLEGRTRQADSLVRALRARASDEEVIELRAFRSFALADRAMQKRVTTEIMARGDVVPASTALHVAVYADDLDGTEQFGRALLAQRRSPDVVAYGHRLLAQVAVARGRWSVARRELRQASAIDSVAALELLALYGSHEFLAVQPAELDSIRAALLRWNPSAMTTRDQVHNALHGGIHEHIRVLLLALVSLRGGDSSAALQYATELERLPSDSGRAEVGRTFARSVRARVQASAGRDAEALKTLDDTRWQRIATLFIAEAPDRFLRATLLVKTGKGEDASGWYASMAQRAAYELVYLAPSHLELARIAESRGTTESAITHYGRFTELWSDADPALQPVVDDARRRLAALRAPPSR